MRIKNKRAAIEMSMTTFVTIVLVVIVMVLAIFFIQKIFASGTNAIDQIDAKIQSELDNLFAAEGKPLVIYPKERIIRMEPGDDGGFGFSIKNVDSDEGDFMYSVSVFEKASTCTMTETQAENLIILGKRSNSPITLRSLGQLDDAILVKFEIPNTAPLCSIRYKIDVTKNGGSYANNFVDLKII